MTVFEVLSIVAIAFTALISVSSILGPILQSRWNIKEQNKRLNTEIYQSVFDNFVNAYGVWRSDPDKKKDLYASIYKIMSLCSESTKSILKSLINELQSSRPFHNSDDYFYQALDQISEEFKSKML